MQWKAAIRRNLIGPVQSMHHHLVIIAKLQDMKIIQFYGQSWEVQLHYMNTVVVRSPNHQKSMVFTRLHQESQTTCSHPWPQGCGHFRCNVRALDLELLCILCHIMPSFPCNACGLWPFQILPRRLWCYFQGTYSITDSISSGSLVPPGMFINWDSMDI